MALILPYRRKTFQEITRAGFYYDYWELTGNECSIAELTQILATLPRERVIRWICAVTGWVSKDGNNTPQAHRRAAIDLLPPELFKAYDKLIAEEGAEAGILFHRRQAWFVLQLAMLVCRDDAPGVEDETLRRTLGKCCLMGSDIIQRIDEYNRPETPTDIDENLWAVASFLPLYDVHTFDRCVARAHDLWFECTSSPVARRKAAQEGVEPDVAKVFEEAYGIPLKDFVMFCSLTSVFFEGSQLADAASPLLFDPGKAFADQFDPACAAAILKMISQTPDELSTALMSSRQSWSFDLSVLRDRPLIRLPGNKFCCPDISMLTRLEIDRVSALLTDAYPKKKFAKYFGHLFEEYFDRCITASEIQSSILATMYFSSPKFVGGEDEVADGLYLGVKCAVLFESKASRLTSRQKFAASPDETAEQLQEMFCKEGQGGGQLSKSIRRLIAGEKIASPTLPPTSLKEVRRFVPVLVTYEQTVGINAVRTSFQESFNSLLAKAQIDPARVSPFLVLTVRDVEILAAARKTHSLEDLILQYVQYIDENGPHLLGGFIDFMHRNNTNVSDVRDINRSMAYATFVKARAAALSDPPAKTE